MPRERLTLMRVFEELGGLGYEGGYDSVRRYAKAWRMGRGAVTAAACVPLSFAPREAYQFDWSHEVVLINGVTVTVKVAHVRLCHSRMLFVRPIRARPRRWCSMRVTVPSPSLKARARAGCLTIYGRLPPQDEPVGVGGAGCVNLSGLSLERSRSWP